MANTKLALILGLAVVGTIAAFLVFNNGTADTYLKGGLRNKLRGHRDLLLLGGEDNLETLFTQWKNTYNKTYGGAENRVRFHNFAYNYHNIQLHNAQNLSWTLELNQFADLTSEEFKIIYLGYKADKKNNNATRNVADLKDVKAGDAVDWREKGAVTPVKDQGQCGSCWAFSTTGALEGRNFIANGKLVSLSEQELVDCSGAYGNQGCNGGLMDDGFQFVQAKGITTEANYPYKAVDGRCNAKAEGQIAVQNKGFQDVAQNDPNALLQAVAQGPVAVAIEADQTAFQFYNGGVITARCGTNLDHGVLVVGYGTDATKGDYWIVKNSWGATWGEKGYVRIARGTQNNGAGVCGINSQPSFPTF